MKDSFNHKRFIDEHISIDDNGDAKLKKSVSETLQFFESQIEKTRREAEKEVNRGIDDEVAKAEFDAHKQGFKAGLERAIELIPDSAGASYWHMKEILKSELDKK